MKINHSGVSCRRADTSREARQARRSRRRRKALAVVEGHKGGSRLSILSPDPPELQCIHAAPHGSAAGIPDGAAPRLARPSSATRLQHLDRGIPIDGPFPDIADHVEQAVAIGVISADRRGAIAAIGALKGEGEEALSIVLAPHLQARAPRPTHTQRLQGRTAPQFRFRFSPQRSAHRGRISLGVPISPVHHGMVEKLVRSLPAPRKRSPILLASSGGLAPAFYRPTGPWTPQKLLCVRCTFHLSSRPAHRYVARGVPGVALISSLVSSTRLGCGTVSSVVSRSISINGLIRPSRIS